LNLDRWIPAKAVAKPEKPVSSPGIVPKVAQESKPVVTPPVPPAASPTTPAAPNQNASDLKQKILSSDQQETHISAFNAIAESWGARPVKIFSGKLTVPDAYTRLARKRNLRVTPFKGTLDEVIRFDLPFLIVTKVSGSLKNYCFAVTSVQKDSVTINPPISGRSTLTKNEFLSISSGIYYLVWQNPGQIPDTIEQDEKLYEVRKLQQLLKRAKVYQGAVNGNYDSLTSAAVREFQHSVAITPDENPGELTLAALTRFETGQHTPSLSSTGKNK
jgi:general secretion pathway protein A